jgi:hypothetical protein
MLHNRRDRQLENMARQEMVSNHLDGKVWEAGPWLVSPCSSPIWEKEGGAVEQVKGRYYIETGIAGHRHPG